MVDLELNIHVCDLTGLGKIVYLMLDSC